MMKVDPKTLLNTKWDELTIKGTKKTKCISKKIIANEEENNTSVMLFNNFKKIGKNDTQALINSLLINHSVVEVALKWNTLMFVLEDGRKINVKITANDIIDDAEEIIKNVVQNYVKTRHFVVKKLLETKTGEVVLNNEQYKSGVNLVNNTYYFDIMGEERYAFGLDDGEFQVNLISELINDCDKNVTYSEEYDQVNTGIYDFDQYDYGYVLSRCTLSLGDINVCIINPGNNLALKLQNKVSEHNKEIDDLNISVTKYIKKDGKKGV